MKQLVIGLGEVGSALKNILECDGFDEKMGEPYDLQLAHDYDVLHIAFPYSDNFKMFVLSYERRMRTTPLLIVHSSVPVGTCDPHGWVHSPVRGIHPNLEEGIRTFVKFFGGKNSAVAANIFLEKKIKVHVCELAKNTEAMKLWDTTIYGLNILIEKGIYAFCAQNGLDFETVYTYANATYNEGYTLLGHPEFSKFVLKDFPGSIGGHCVRENWELLDDPIARISKDLHKRLTDS